MPLMEPFPTMFPLDKWIAPFKSSVGIASGTAQVGTNGDINICSFYTKNPITITRFELTLSVLGGAGTFLRLGLYSNGGTLAAPTPDGGSLLWDSGNIAADVTTVKDIAVSPTVLVKDWFFACLETNDGVIQFNRYSAAAWFTDQSTEKITGSFVNQAFGALPATMPATTISGTKSPYCVLRWQ